MQEKEYIKDQITAVIPVYNEERFLRQCLESVVDQVDYVILGDNASTDGTEAICREFTEKYGDKIVYFRNEENLGGAKNGILCHEKVQTEFVFHIGGHDLIPADYVKTLKNMILSRSDVVCAFADVYEMIDEHDTKCHPFSGLDDLIRISENSNPYYKAYQFFTCGNSWHPIYGVIRTKVIISVLQYCLPIRDVDYALVFSMYLKGIFLYTDETKYFRRDVHGQRTGNDNHDAYMKRIVGDSQETIPDVNGNRSFVEQILRIYNACDCEEHVKSKKKYLTLLKCRLYQIYDVPTNEYFLDVKLRLKRFIKNNPFRKKISNAIKKVFHKRKKNSFGQSNHQSPDQFSSAR